MNKKSGPASEVIGHKGQKEETLGCSQSNWFKGNDKYLRAVANKYWRAGLYDKITIKYGEKSVSPEHTVQFKVLKEKQIWPERHKVIKTSPGKKAEQISDHDGTLGFLDALQQRTKEKTSIDVNLDS